jgi:hypothetical protein
MAEQMPSPRMYSCGAVFAVLLLGGASGCGASFSLEIATTSSFTRTPVEAATAQRPGSCRIAPPKAHFPTGEWTATETILSTSSIDACAGERLVRPWDFRELCRAGTCKTYLLTASYYGVGEAQIAPDGPDRYVAVFQPQPVPCPHRPGEDAGTNQDYSTITLSWSPRTQTLHGISREHQVGPCGGGPAETSSYVATRTNPTANPPAQGP